METGKIVNLKAPRFNFKAKRLLGDSNFMNKFFKKYPEHKGAITARQFTKIITTFNTLFWRTVISWRWGVELPERLGLVQLKSCPPHKNFVDKRKYRQGIKVIEKNLHTEGRILKIFFSNNADKYAYDNKELWGFAPGEDFAAAASKAFVIDWRKYEQIEFVKEDIAKRAKKEISKEYAISKKEDYLVGYDEFAFD